jgi:WD40 repeat protein
MSKWRYLIFGGSLILFSLASIGGPNPLEAEAVPSTTATTPAPDGLIRTFSGHTDVVTSVVFSPNGKIVLTGSLDGTAKLWDLASGVNLNTFSRHLDQDMVLGVAFSPDGKSILTANTDNYQPVAILWDVTSAAMLRTFSGHKGTVTSVAFSPDDKIVLTGSQDTTAIVWDVLAA